MLMVLYSYEVVYVYTVITTLLAVAIQLIVHKILNGKKKTVKNDIFKNIKVPIGFYMCTANIVILIVTNFCIVNFY